MVVVADAPPPSSPSPSPTPLGKVRVRCRIPLWFRAEVVRRSRITGAIVVIEVLWGTRSRWREWMLQHDTRRLDVFEVGPFVIAVGLV